MKTLKNSIKLFSLFALTSITFTACSDDDDNNTNEDQNPTTVSKRLYTSNNADGNITYYDVTDMSNITATTLITTSVAADGVYYDGSSDTVIQASRSGLALEGFANATTLASGATVTAAISGSDDLVSPREVAVNGNFYVVADNADVDGDATTPDGRLFIYEKDGDDFELRNTVTINFKLWGIVFNGQDLYAIVDATGDLAVFNGFLSNSSDATVEASKRITIEGIVRTHGIAFDVNTNTAVLTDIGSAMDATDGGFHVISNFTTKLNATANNGTLAVSDQVRVSGNNTVLGNPVDVAYDGETETVFIAEAANGKILAFNNIGTGGNLTPVVNNNLMSASAVHLSKD